MGWAVSVSGVEWAMGKSAIGYGHRVGWAMGKISDGF